VYGIDDYGRMIADTVRTGAYAEALRSVVRPDSVVVDLGTGPGIFALLACAYGARRVYAIESDPIIDVAKRMAADNGFAGRIEFVEDVSTRVNLPERADVIVSDLPACSHIDVILDARRRFLAPGGTMIPQRDMLWAVLVEAPEAYDRVVGPWCAGMLGVDMRAALSLATERVENAWIASDQMLVEPRRLAALDYQTADDLRVSALFDWTVQRAGTAHGISIWFEVTMTGGIGFSNAPGSTATSFLNRNLFLPLKQPILVRAGDRLDVHVSAGRAGASHFWRWKTSGTINEADGCRRVDYTQCSLLSTPVASSDLRKREADHLPDLNDDAEADYLALDLMRKHLTLGEIARRIAEAMPERFPSWLEALGHVGTLSVKYSR